MAPYTEPYSCGQRKTVPFSASQRRIQSHTAANSARRYRLAPDGIVQAAPRIVSDSIGQRSTSAPLGTRQTQGECHGVRHRQPALYTAPNISSQRSIRRQTAPVSALYGAKQLQSALYTAPNSCRQCQLSLPNYRQTDTEAYPQFNCHYHVRTKNRTVLKLL